MPTQGALSCAWKWLLLLLGMPPGLCELHELLTHGLPAVMSVYRLREMSPVHSMPTGVLPISVHSTRVLLHVPQRLLLLLLPRLSEEMPV